MVEIRALTDADIDQVAAVHVRGWQAGYAGIVPADHLAGLDVAAFAERRRTRTPPTGSHTLVAVDGGRVIGFAGFGPYRRENGDPDRGRGELYAIYVDPDHWGRGAGRLLLAAARTALTAAGYPDMRLWVLEENAAARRFYARMGLAPDGTRHFYTPPGTTVELPELRYVTAL